LAAASFCNRIEIDQTAPGESAAFPNINSPDTASLCVY
jgi:hypothetical protein